MKRSQLIILFVVFTIPFHMMLDLKTKNIENAMMTKLEIDQILDTATTDGTVVLSKGLGMEVNQYKEEAVDTFYKTLYLNFNATDSYQKNRIKGYVPVILIVDYDGVYVFSHEEYKNTQNELILRPIWSMKKPYTYYDGDYVYNFSLEDDVVIYQLSSGKQFRGKHKDLKTKISSSIIQEDQLFEQVRRRTIIEVLQREMNFCINNHNLIASQYGITYQFSLPVIEEEDWNKTIDDISMIAFFQGLPLGSTGMYYNNFAIGGARLIKKDPYFIEEDVASGVTYYHKKDCPLLVDSSNICNSPAECALQGAYPCSTCRP